ncbi:hypothetical protein, partial [Devosia psychrophila]|uniref:hypothetical protein n=1 Tax=Devosia psychrophila TaxID=728005 RepID=UPI001AEC131E
RRGTQNTKGKTRHLTIPASRETIVQPGHFSMTIPGQIQTAINSQMSERHRFAASAYTGGKDVGWQTIQ